jgi:hypothetical protein
MATQTIKASTQAPKITNYPRGDSRLLSFTIFQSDGKTPFDLTGCEVFFTVNPVTDPGATDSGAVIELSTTSFTNPTSGAASLTITNADTQNVTPATYYYDVQLKDANGNITSLAQNTFQVIADITRRIS